MCHPRKREGNCSRLTDNRQNMWNMKAARQLPRAVLRLSHVSHGEHRRHLSRLGTVSFARCESFRLDFSEAQRLATAQEIPGLMLARAQRQLVQRFKAQAAGERVGKVVKIPATIMPRFRPGVAEGSVGARRASRRCSTWMNREGPRGTLPCAQMLA
jgi:hypothetical protein